MSDEAAEEGALFGGLLGSYDDDDAAAGSIQPMLNVVVQPVPTPTSVRRRRPPPPPELAVEEPLPPLPPAEPVVRRVYANLDARYQRVQRRCARGLDGCYAARNRLVAVSCLLATLTALVVFAVPWAYSEPGAHVVERIRPMYARHGHDGVDLRRTATELACAEITSGVGHDSLDRARAAAEHFIVHDDALRCVCGPMFRLPRRYVAIRTSATTLVHAYNPAIDRAWDGTLDDGTRVNVTDMLVVENQRMLFPERTADVNVVRASAIRITYRDATCATAALVLQLEHAYCMQACIDLLDGRSVYDVAEPV